ncbi:uncharacterized protein SETTUDRAFT_34756 [Exserohilum turcica Et28A]|uniref:NADH:ubiquinone oxidoreductase intermediate-associated protein 30 domain-containing protein n=1 Tax=Exserohilum turcicum (strain 28A) TaxID=671987 RepID=R0JWY0_EXST2|nr:uncharacterized protein SETTUDRAFT_34756 [Exserohilum turcica Et28A]EOA81999.1 hypothetical protein SETTUDRAFT_34756 [Exserohilum turcica Et28A]
MTCPRELTIFGGVKGWNAADWTASDDTVRGGSSYSRLTIEGSSACFHGNLNYTTLGGAGFASQRTTGENRSWDLSAYDGIFLDLGSHDGKKYTITLKDTLLPPLPDGREQSSLNFEFDFESKDDMGVFVPWGAMKPTYRGREQNDTKPLNTQSVKRFSIMIRSFFAEQQGDFDLVINSIKAVSHSGDGEKGIAGVRRGIDVQEPWSWKNSNMVGLAVILGTAWAVSWVYCKWKGYDTSIMRFSKWLSAVKN